LLILVGGAPGSGKSTLAALLADALSLPLLGCDRIKVGLAETHGTDDATIGALNRAAVGIFYRTATHLLGAGVSVVADFAWRRGLSEPDMAPLVGAARAVLVHCWCPEEEAARRFRVRSAQADRHPSFRQDAAIIDRMARGTFDWAEFEPPAVDARVLRVDTTAGHVPALAEIIAFCRGVPTATPMPADHGAPLA
jgi:predicted kinase